MLVLVKLPHTYSKLKAGFERQINCVDHPKAAKAFLQVEQAGRKHCCATAIERHNQQQIKGARWSTALIF